MNRITQMFIIIYLGFDCSLPRICCGTETERYCCIPPKPSLSSLQVFDPSPDDIVSSNESTNFLSEKWFYFQLCALGVFFLIILLGFITIYRCLKSIRRKKQRQQTKVSVVPVSLPVNSPLLMQYNRPMLNRMSTISSVPSDTKTRCTDTTSKVFSTSLNLYPTSNSRNSTVSSYYVYPNEFEQLCK